VKTNTFPTALCALTLFSSALGARAATLVVDAKAPAASDANPGTRALPFQTIQAAADKARAGDTVLVRAGLYRESVTLRQSGTPAAPITLKSEVPGGAVIDGADVVSLSPLPASSGLYFYSTPELSPTGNDFPRGEQMYVNGEPLELASDAAKILPGGFFFDIPNKRVLVRLSEGQTPESVKVEYARRGGLIAPDHPLDDIHVQGFTLTHGADPFSDRFSLTVSGRRWLVEDNRIFWASYAGIRINKSNGCILRRNLIEWCGATGNGGYGNINMLFENNVIRHCNWRRQNPDFDGGAGKWVFTYNSTFRGNEAGYNHGYGLWLDIACGGNTFDGNINHDQTKAGGPFSEISWKTTLQNNVVFNNDIGMYIGESSDCNITNNLLLNNRSGGIYVRTNYDRNTKETYGWQNEAGFRAQITRDIPGITPEELDTIARDYKVYWVDQPFFAARDNVISGNRFLDNRIGLFEWRNYAEKTKLDTVLNSTGDGNTWAGTPDDALVNSHAGGYGSLANWRKVSGRDAHSSVLTRAALVQTLPAAQRRWVPARPFRSWEAIDALHLALVQSPQGAELTGRMLRSPDLTRVDVGDSRVQAFAMTVAGQRTLAIWTADEGVRVPLQLSVGNPKVELESAYLNRSAAKATDGTIPVVATFLPQYVRGVGAQIGANTLASLETRGFNLPGQPIPASASFVNRTGQAQTLRARFSVGQGFSVAPATFAGSLAANQTLRVPLTVSPDATLARGMGTLSVGGTLGGQTISRSAAFVVGEGSGNILHLASALPVDGDAAKWTALGAKALVGTVSDASQIVGDDKSKWSGAKDLSAKIYGGWTSDALQLLVDVRDDQVVPAPEGGALYNSDAVELFVDGRGPVFQYQKEPTAGVFQIALAPDSPTRAGGPRTQVLSKAPLTGMQSATRRTSDGYTVEVRLPLTAANFPAGEFAGGRPLKMSVLIDDADDVGAGRTKIIGWSFSPGGANFNDTSGWKTLLLGS